MRRLRLTTVLTLTLLTAALLSGCGRDYDRVGDSCQGGEISQNETGTTLQCVNGVFYPQK